MLSDMARADLLRDVLDLPVTDRVEIFERLRDNLERDPNAMSLSAEQEVELDRRYQEFLASPDEGLTLDEVEAKLAASRRP